MSTFDDQRERLTVQYHEPGPCKTITSHDVVTACYTEQWIDPAQKLIEQARTRKRLAIDAMLQEIERLHEQIAILKA